MSPIPYYKLHDGRREDDRKVAKHTIKYLSHLRRPDPRFMQAIIRDASPRVIKGLGNLAYNMKHNEGIKLKPHERRFLSRHRAPLDLLANPKYSIRTKQLLLSDRHPSQQRGGALPLIPILAAALPFLIKKGLAIAGSAILGGVATGVANKLTAPSNE